MEYFENSFLQGCVNFTWRLKRRQRITKQKKTNFIFWENRENELGKDRIKVGKCQFASENVDICYLIWAEAFLERIWILNRLLN